MRKIIYIIAALVASLLISKLGKASDYNQQISLDGSWSFKIGDDPDWVYLNGNQLGRTESRNYNIRANADYRKNRVYEIPSRMLKTENVVVVEVNDYHGVGGIYEGPVGIMTEKNVKIYFDRIKEEYREINSFWEFIDYAFD